MEKPQNNNKSKSEKEQSAIIYIEKPSENPLRRIYNYPAVQSLALWNMAAVQNTSYSYPYYILALLLATAGGAVFHTTSMQTGLATTVAKALAASWSMWQQHDFQNC